LIEPPLDRPGQRALFGVTDDAGDLTEWNVGVSQVPLGLLAADVVDQLVE
jgi:hypothetical protein